MKIAFFTEMGFHGKVPRDHPNMRVEFAWMCAMDMDHYNINETPNEKYDLGLVLIPKKNIESLDISRLKQVCDKIGVLQEGPHWFFQDHSMERQIWYYNTLCSADIIYCHNKIDKKYYEGLTNHKDIRVIQSLMIEDSIPSLPQIEREGVIIGGNMCSWYGGFDSYIVASSVEHIVYAPSMGRRIKDEENLITHLPYQTWNEWIISLNQFKYGVHLMRTQAAGTFALNCSYLGIPCIGYVGLDTQEILHPNLTVEVGDLKAAKNLLHLLHTNSDFYNEQSLETKQRYENYYNESKFIANFTK